MLCEIGQDIDRYVGGRILDLSDVVPTNAGKGAQRLLREVGFQSGRPHVLSQRVTQRQINREWGYPAALVRHVRFGRPHCARSQ